MKEFSIAIPDNVMIIEPVGWLELMVLTKNAQFVLTDSGGLQKEAFWHGKQCFTLRNETEWIETIHQKSNILIKEGDHLDLTTIHKGDFTNPYGSGNSSTRIVEIINVQK